MPSLDATIGEVRGRVAMLVAVSWALRALAVLGFAWGTAVVVARLVADPPVSLLASGAAAIPVALALATRHGCRRRPSAEAVRALLDRHGRRGGLVMAAGEAELGGWSERQAPPPELRLARREGGVATLAVAAGYVALAFVVPTDSGLLAEERRLEVDGPAAELADRVEALAEEGVLAEEEADRIASELERVLETASASDPARTWEALDHLRETVERAAAAAAQETAAEETRLAATAAVAEALAGGAGEAARGATALAELARLAAEAAGSAALDPATAAELARLAEALGAAGGELADLDPALLARLAAAAAAGKGELAGALERLRIAGVGELKPASGGEGDADAALLAFLEAREMNASAAACRLAGRGGVTRGRGDAELTWKDPSAEGDAAFREETLPRLARLDRSRLLGVDTVDPSGLSAGEGSTGGALSGATVGGGAAHTQTLLPRHRGAVRRYFERAGEARREGENGR